ncbi:uncharacterized protein METZ01_LOCUS445164, partial [marine metagenome]
LKEAKILIEQWRVHYNTLQALQFFELGTSCS